MIATNISLNDYMIPCSFLGYLRACTLERNKADFLHFQVCFPFYQGSTFQRTFRADPLWMAWRPQKLFSSVKRQKFRKIWLKLRLTGSALFANVPKVSSKKSSLKMGMVGWCDVSG